MTSLEALKEILRLEQEYKLYDFEIDSIKLWNLFRTPYRYIYVSKMTGVSSITRRVTKMQRAKFMLRNSFSSIIRLIQLLPKHGKIENVVIPNSRLQIYNGQYFDKFTDPVIDESELRNSCCILHMPYAYDYYPDRRHSEMIVPMDFLYLLCYIILPVYLIPHLLFGNYIKIYRMYKVINSILPLSGIHIIRMNVWFMRIHIMSIIYSLLFRFLGVKRVFGVARQSFYDAIIGAHRNGITVYEFQHGVTHGETEYYSGPQCPVLDPDFFLSFGEMWNGKQFGIDPSKIINIGWAYKNEMIEKTNEFIPNSVLFISSPEISFKMLDLANNLSERYPQYRFYIRCHPYEKYTDKQLRVVDESNNLFLDDNSIDSQIALCRYQFIVGENSSVIYEALSLGKKVGRICYNGIISMRFSDKTDDGFVYLYNEEDFLNLVNCGSSHIENKAYSDFKPDLLNSLLKN